MSGRTTNLLGWQQIAGPAIAIDTSTLEQNPNIRCDPTGISIWERSGSPRHWQYWEPPADGVHGWSSLFEFPADYAGPVGQLTTSFASPHSNLSFDGMEYNVGDGAVTGSFRISRVWSDGTISN